MSVAYIIQTVKVSRNIGEIAKLVPPYPHYQFVGIGSSPIIYTDIVYVVWRVPDPLPNPPARFGDVLFQSKDDER